MANNVDRVLDDSDLLPEGLIYTPAKKRVNNEEFAYEEGGEFLIDEDEFGMSGVAEDEDRLRAPEFIRVIDQTVRTAADGRQVVDVVIETDDIPGALKFEVRVTAA